MMVTAQNYIRNDNEDDLPDFSDPDDYVDNISDEELLPELMQKEPRLAKSTEKIIVIDNIPKVGTDRKDKLKGILIKLLNGYGKIVNEFYPEEENGTLKGYMFVEYDNDVSAGDAVSQLNAYRLDKAHTFKVNFFDDFDKYQNLNLAADVEVPVAYKDPGNLLWWHTEPPVHNCYDQFSILHGDKYISVFANVKNTRPLEIQSREKWAETTFQWSPKGTYLATFHDRGIALWAGKSWAQFMRFAHQGVQLIDFSPSEKYLVTCNPSKAGVDDSAMIIWCTRSGQKKRSFSLERSMNMSWPYFRWNSDDKYFARLGTDQLFVYETETFVLLEKKAIKVPHISDFEWSPVNNLISYWVAERKDVPARVVLLEIPSKNEIRSKNIVNVGDCKMYWQNMGDYLCVKVERYKKSNTVKEDDKEVVRYSGLYYNFEFFRIREKEIPVDSIEIKELCYSFGWEPNGQKFGIIYGESPTRTTAAFYKIVNPTGNQQVAGKLELIKELKGRSVVQLLWSPQGQYCVLATTVSKSQSGLCIAEFIDVQSSDAVMLNSIEHEHMTDIEWDPTGRFLVSYVSNWNHKTDNAYQIWNFQGKNLQKISMDKLYKFSWRPRPTFLITPEHIKDIRKNFKQYSEKYTMIDRKEAIQVSQEILEKRRAQMKEFLVFRNAATKRYAEAKSKRMELRNNVDTDNLVAKEEIEYSVQFLVESKKEEVNE